MIRTFFLLGFACTFLAFGGRELLYHAQAIKEMQAVSSPALQEIPRLEQRLNALTQQTETASLQASLFSQGSPEEYVSVYLLPPTTDLDKTVLLFDALGEQLQAENRLANMSRVIFGPLENHNDYSVQPVSVQMALHKKGLEDIALFIQLAGIRTVNDLLNAEDRELLIQRSEQESPASILVLQEFLNTDLLIYSQNPILAREKVLQAFGSELFRQGFAGILDSGRFAQARTLLNGPLGKLLNNQKLWPMQFMTLDKLDLKKGAAEDWYNAEVTVLVYTQE